MATNSFVMTFPKSTGRRQSQTQNVQDIGEPITLSPDNGTASYTISGRDITVTVDNGNPKNDTVYSNGSDYRVSTDPSSFPSQVYYDVGGYTGWIDKSGSYYQFGIESGETLYGQTWDQAATLIWRFRWTGTAWMVDTSPGSTSVDPAQIYHTDINNHSGWMNYNSWNGSTPNYPPLSAGQGQPVGYTTTRSVVGSATYKGDLTRPDKITYAQDYYGQVSATVTSYSYNVTVTYTVIPRRPGNFTWTVPKISGGDFNVLATEWNDLCSRVNDFRRYKGYNDASFTTAYTGNDFLASMYNEIRNGITPLNSSVPSTRSKGDTVYASDLNQLVTALNSVP